eukprot:UN34851
MSVKDVDADEIIVWWDTNFDAMDSAIIEDGYSIASWRLKFIVPAHCGEKRFEALIQATNGIITRNESIDMWVDLGAVCEKDIPGHIPSTGSIQCFSDSLYTTPSDEFMLDDTVFCKTSFLSFESLDEIRIKEARVTQGNNEFAVHDQNHEFNFLESEVEYIYDNIENNILF